MEQRENALREALENNAVEVQRWEHYEAENTTAIENLDKFGKRLTVDVMVPVGSKAFMPGQLIHTNEVLVGHYQGYFSKCSAHKAKEICERRIAVAKERLQLLSNEAELWQNKLDKPYAEGVLPQASERDIIEDYDEEKEQRWREEHKKRVKQAKLQEKAERESSEQQMETPAKDTTLESKTEEDIDVQQLLKEAEMLEELEQELQTLQIDHVDDEMLRQLMAGEVDIGTKKARVAHNSKKEVTENIVPFEKLQGVVKKSDANRVLATNNNSRPNPELLADIDGNDSDDSEESDIPEEVRIIKDQAKFLPTADQIGFYEYQIQIIRQKLLTLPLSNQEEIDAKIHQLTVLEHVEELLDMVEETLGAAELAESEAKEKVAVAAAAVTEEKISKMEEVSSNTEDQEKTPVQKRRISFALADQTLEFRKNETVAQMLPKVEQPKRDIIRLDESLVNVSTKIPSPKSENKKSILEKVEGQRKFVAENQSTQDFDLVNKILTAETVKTLHINFKHSAQSAEPTKHSSTKDVKDAEIPGSPADFYDSYLKSLANGDKQQSTTVFVNAYKGEDQVRVPVLREANRQEAYEDPRIAYSKPHKNTENVNSRSILRNKEAVENEGRISVNNNVVGPKTNSNKTRKKKPSTPVNEDVYMSAYNKVMKEEVVEKQLDAPDPLPKGKFIDALAPKKRVSRFKQMRAEKT